MNKEPYEQTNSERRQEMRNDEEAFRLQRQEGRLEERLDVGRRRGIYA